MARSKHAKPDEHLLGEVRSLKKLVKSLRQRIRQLEKTEHNYEENKDVVEQEEQPVIQKLQTCEDCGKGKYIEFEIMNKIIGTCNNCGHRTRLK